MTEELQQEEIEVLKSIYEGDENFKEINKTLPTFQYKVCDKDEQKSFLLEIVWEKEYPDVKPQFNLDAFYNKQISLQVKESIIAKINEEAEQYLGTAMTYTLIEWAKENSDDLLIDLVDDGDSIQIQNQDLVSKSSVDLEKLDLVDTDKPNQAEKQKKLNLSKSQKKKMFDQLNSRGERPRGWDWVDVIKHLSQSGSKQNVAQSES